MRVGVNARTFMVDEPDGAVQTARKLTRRLARKDHVDIVLFGNPELDAEFDGIDEVRSTGFYSDSPFFGVVWERTILPMLAKCDDLDVLLCPNANAPPISVGCPIVTYVHDVNAQKGMSSGVHQLYRKFAVPLGIQNSDTIVTVSKFSKREIVEHLPVSSEDVHVVYNGVDGFYLKPGGSEPIDLPNQYILYVGAMNPRKNIDRLVAAYDLNRDDVPHKLVLIGPQNKSVYKKLEVDSFSEDIVTPGFIPREQLKSAYENATVFVYPSLYEGFGLPPLEAMACNTPAIVSDTSSLPEVVGDAALQVDPDDPTDIAEAMEKMLTDNELREAFAAEGRTRADSFTWDSSGEQLIEVLNRTVR